MRDRFKEFVTHNLEEFDEAGPNESVLGKIDSRMDADKSSFISSKWLSRFKYLSLSASMLILAAYFASKGFSNSAQKNNPNQIPQHLSSRSQAKSTLLSSIVTIDNTDQKKTRISASNETNSSKKEQTRTVQQTETDDEQLQPAEKNPELMRPMGNEAASEEQIHSLFTAENTRPETKISNPEKNNKGKKFNIPAEPLQANIYTGTLYEFSDLCEILRVYKFPGKVSLDRGARKYLNNSKSVMKTISCSRIQNTGNIKAVWLKGITSEQFVLSLSEDFRNIIMTKADGREVNPIAISHYYPGLGLISDYRGKFFNLLFTDKVEMILLFENAEGGDKIMVDGFLEAVIAAQP